jgi:phospholipase C
LAALGGNGLAAAQTTATPITHLIVVFQENVSFDHYFGTYPRALNLPGERPFVAAPGTPSVNGLTEACCSTIRTRPIPIGCRRDKP